MTNSNHTVEETVAVIQADRDAAKPFFNEGGPAYPQLVQAFARHRLASHSAPAVERIRAQAFEEAAEIADKWRDENKAAAAKARKRAGFKSFVDGDETGFVMAEQLDGAAIECNAIAHEIRKLASLPPSTHDELVDALRAMVETALDGLDSIAGDRTPEFFPETSYDCARRVAAKVRAALTKMGEKL